MSSISEDLAYTPEGLAVLQNAHRLASEKLRRDPSIHEHADRLARIVLKLFNHGIRDVKAIAKKAADEEAAICGIKPPPPTSQRRSRLPFH
jgi:hypothetical protein